MKRLSLVLWLALLPLPTQAACRLALAIALDVSGSVDATEYRLQMSGLAAALKDPDVEAALFAIPEAPVALAIYEWSSSRYQRVVQDWTLVENRDVLTRVQTRLLGWQRKKAPEATGLGAAMEFGKAMLDRGPACWTKTLDVSGDGKNNDWPDPRLSRASGALAGIRINGLVIARDTGSAGEKIVADAGELSAYFLARVVQGPDAFVEVAAGFEDYAAAMRRKLLRELKSQPIGMLPKMSGDAFVPASLHRSGVDQ